MVATSSTTNQWSHEKNQEVDGGNLMGSSGGATRVMEKPTSGQDQPPPPPPPPQQQTLKCPRCDSSNTKFCYYNNYSLSQPRHFCKACKRYWTRGGTLRNVPVGGGCRKNKRIKRPSPSSSAINGHDQSVSNHPQIDLPSSTSSLPNHHHIINPVLYGLPPTDSNHNNRVLVGGGSRVFDSSGYDDHSMGLGFSFSSLLSGGVENALGFANHSSSNNNNSLLSSCYPVFGSSSSSPTSSSTTLASLLASRLHHQANEGRGLPAPYVGSGQIVKEVKMEVNNNTWDNNNGAHYQIINQMNNSSSDYNWNNNGSWFDPSNMGSSSVPSILFH